MNRRLWITLVFALAVAGLAAAARSLRGSHEPLETVPFVDLTRYSGKWHEIARFPNRFQRNCIGETTAIYTLQDDGTIAVLNQCRKRNGSFTSARGRARVAGGKGPNSKLKVTFFWPFRGDYWIIDLDPDYQWAVVGEPRRRYLWILAGCV
jgi:apolipoprotein D and lipocalin family protein